MTVANLKVFLISRGMNRESDWELKRIHDFGD